MDVQIGTEQFEAVAAKLRQSNQNLIALETTMRSQPAVAARIGRDVVRMRMEHNQWADRFTTLYGAVFGTVPAGLQGPILVAAAVVTALVAIGGAVAVLIVNEQRRMEEARTMQMVQTTAQSLLQQAAQKDIEAKEAEAKGDPTRARQLAQEAAQLRQQAGVTATGAPPAPKPTDWQTWLQSNLPWVAIGIGAIVVLPRMLEAAVGRRGR